MRFERVVFALALLWACPADALCTSFGVTATMLDFGIYDPGTGAPVPSTGSVVVKCGIGILPEFGVSLSKGAGTFAQRQMANGTERLNYNLYIDGSHMTVWGDGTDGTVTQGLSGLITLGSTTYTVYGLADAGQYPAPGAYTDTITVTVNF